MSDYEQVELYPRIRPSTSDEYAHFVAEYDDWKYTFEVHRQYIALVQVTRPWQVGDPSPPEWVPAAAEERVEVTDCTRADIPAPVFTAFVARGVLGGERSLRIRC